MASGYSSETNIPFLGSGETETEQKWWRKILDLDAEESKKQIFLSVPMSLTSISHYSIPLISVMFAGHVGNLQLAGATLANSWAVVTGWSFVIGLSGALETLCGQGYGAQMYGMLGVYLQASCIASFFFCILISIIWWYSGTILLVIVHQEPQIANAAGVYLKFMIPALFAFALLQNILRFLQAQSVVAPLVLCSVLLLLIHVPLAYGLVHRTGLGYGGAGLAVSVSFCISAIMMMVYVKVHRRNKFRETWVGISLEAFCYVTQTLKLALPSTAMVCLEYWAFEVLVLIAGLMPNQEISTSLIAMCENTEATACMIAYGLGATASTKVSNELGAGNPAEAKRAMAAGLKLCALLAFAVALALAFGHGIWARLSTDSPVIIELFASTTPLLIVSIVVDIGSQGVLSGVARGCGWQNLAVINNLATYYFVGLTAAVVLAFKMELYAKGFGLLLLCVFSKWSRVELTSNDV